MTLYIEQALNHELAKAEVPLALRSEPLLSKSFSCMYKIATCEGSCRGGDHIIESLVGRGVNQTLSALTLVSIGQYDEALSLVRSLGEVTNLLAFFSLSPDDFRTWASSSRQDRIKNYQPAKIRKAIETKGQIAVPMEESVYSELCEAAVHVTPDTAPNRHSPSGQRNVGGVRQAAGEARVLSLLGYLLPQLAMIAASLVDRRDLLPPLVRLIRDDKSRERDDQELRNDS